VAQNGIDKATSIKIVAEKLGIHQRKSLLWEMQNDLTMIEYAGLGVWVDNVIRIRDRADFIVASNNDHGVAEVFDVYFINFF
jgi:hydroxymethylpyrimidine pyrophosphatase-like HAD family hydrolase